MADKAFYAQCSTPKQMANELIGAAVDDSEGIFLQDLTSPSSVQRARARLGPNGKYKNVAAQGAAQGAAQDNFQHVEQFADNISGYMDGEILKYAVDHALELGLTSDTIKAYQNALVKMIIRRNDLLNKEPNFMFLTEMAGCLRAKVETLYESLTAVETRTLRSHIEKIAADIAEGRAVGYESNDIEMMLNQYDIGGHIRELPKVTSAKNKVMLELKQKRGCHAVKGFDVLVKKPEIRSFLAELCAYQIMLWNQLDAKRDYKASDYRRVLDMHKDTWTRFLVVISKTAGTGVGDVRYQVGRVRSFGAHNYNQDIQDQWNSHQAPYSWNIAKRR